MSKYTNIFAQLYDNGDGTETLVFTSDESYKEEGKEPNQSWDITDEHFVVENGIMPPWLNASAGYMNSTIKTVKIANEIKPKYTSCMFAALTRLESIEGMENLNTENTEDMSYMFAFCSSLTNLDLSNWDVSNVTDINYMFTNSGITNLNLSNWNTSNVTDMSGMFSGCTNLEELDLSSFDTRNVTDMRAMFAKCVNLRTVYIGQNWSISQANTENMYFNINSNNITFTKK